VRLQDINRGTAACTPSDSSHFITAACWPRQYDEAAWLLCALFVTCAQQTSPALQRCWLLLQGYFACLTGIFLRCPMHALQADSCMFCCGIMSELNQAVAMTSNDVNYTPALEAADAGVALGITCSGGGKAGRSNTICCSERSLSCHLAFHSCSALARPRSVIGH